uniref:Uncharacterized protein n=1 Tax=Panagrolaimus sp. ES5 TaxID=591445 RepID=A0AC34GSX9_9BILA
MILFWITVFCVALVFPLIDGACTNSTQLKLCYNTYLEAYELSAVPFPGYRAFKTLREMMLVEEGPVGQTKECGFQTSLISCLGNIGTTTDCLSADIFVRTFPNVTHADAILYIQDYFMMQYTCTDGFNDAMKYFYCMEQIGLYYPSKLEACSETEQQQIANDGGCPVYNNFVTCMSNVFTEYCGADIRKYICNLEVKGITGSAPQCANSLQDCSKPPPSN